MSRLLLLVATLGGCHALLPLDEAPHAPDGPVISSTDAQSNDHDSDLSFGDLFPPIDDAGIDSPDPHEASTPDGPATPDGPVTAPDVGTGLKCGTGKPPFTLYSDPKMVVCDDFKGVTYCNAAATCPAGWSVCDSTQYLARGGADEAPGPNVLAWITGCVRKGGSVFPPDPSPCAATCVDTEDSNAPNSIWSCTSNAGGSISSYYQGIAAIDTCNRIGSKQPSSAAFWLAVAWDMKATGAVCCAP